MSENRRKSASFCLKTQANETQKVELFDAELWADGRKGTMRLRVDGRWLDGPDGERLYLDASGIARFVQTMLTAGTMPDPLTRPVLTRGQVVSVPCAPYDKDGFPWGSVQGRVCSERVVLGYDSRWYAVIFAPGIGTTLYPVDDLGGIQ